VIFHSYVSLPEGSLKKIQPISAPPFLAQQKATAQHRDNRSLAFNAQATQDQHMETTSVQPVKVTARRAGLGFRVHT